MGEAFIVRKGGVAEAGEPIPAPTITLVNRTDSSITFTLTNNSIETRDVTFGLTTPPTTTTISLASDATSGNQTFSGLLPGEELTIFAQAEGGIIGLLLFSTLTSPFILATGGTMLEYNSGGKRFKSHTFTNSGLFSVLNEGEADNDRNKVDYLIIAGGGGGGVGGNRGGGGGGAGGYRTTLGTSGKNSTARQKVTVTQQDFQIIVGLGGNGAPDNQNFGTNGQLSTALGVTTVGGGRGGNDGVLSGNNTSATGQPGGSGGGAGADFNAKGALGGIGTTDEGFNGGSGVGSGGGNDNGGGGGGAGQAGFNGSSTMVGGAGLDNTLRTGTLETRAGGGGGRGFTKGSAVGGAGGGGTGNGSNGVINTGSGGGGKNGPTAGNGGSGIVVIRYEIETL